MSRRAKGTVYMYGTGWGSKVSQLLQEQDHEVILQSLAGFSLWPLWSCGQAPLYPVVGPYCIFIAGNASDRFLVKSLLLMPSKSCQSLSIKCRSLSFKSVSLHLLQSILS